MVEFDEFVESGGLRGEIISVFRCFAADLRANSFLEFALRSAAKFI